MCKLKPTCCHCRPGSERAFCTLSAYISVWSWDQCHILNVNDRQRSVQYCPMFLRRRSLSRVFVILLIPLGLHLYLKSSWYTTTDPSEIQENNVLDIVTGSGDLLDARKHKFLQVRIGRDERTDMFSDVISNGLLDYWTRFQKPL